MRGLSCWSKNLIQVSQIRDTVAMPILNRCVKSCSNNPNRNLINTRNSSSTTCISEQGLEAGDEILPHETLPYHSC